MDLWSYKKFSSSPVLIWFSGLSFGAGSQEPVPYTAQQAGMLLAILPPQLNQSLRSERIAGRYPRSRESADYRIALWRERRKPFESPPGEGIVAMAHTIGNHQRYSHIYYQDSGGGTAHSLEGAFGCRTEREPVGPISGQRHAHQLDSLIRTLRAQEPSHDAEISGYHCCKESYAAVGEILRTHPPHLPSGRSDRAQRKFVGKEYIFSHEAVDIRISGRLWAGSAVRIGRTRQKTCLTEHQSLYGSKRVAVFAQEMQRQGQSHALHRLGVDAEAQSPGESDVEGLFPVAGIAFEMGYEPVSLGICPFV